MLCYLITCLRSLSLVFARFRVSDALKSPTSRPFRRQITGLVLNISFWPELEHKMAFVYARKDDVAVASF